MASPLSIFRKYQYLLLVAFGIMLMFAFVIAPPLDNYLRSMSGGGMGADPTVVDWKYGQVTESDLAHMRTQHLLTVSFLQQLVSQVELTEPVPVTIDGQQVQLIKQRLYPLAGQGNSPDGDPVYQIVVSGQLVEIPQSAARRLSPKVPMIQEAGSEQELVRKLLLAKKAELLGVVVNQNAILDYLDNLCDASIKPDYARVLQEATRGKLSEQQLMAQLQHELLAQRMLLMSQSGFYSAPPATLYECYNRLNRRVTAELLPVRVNDFVDQVSEPTEKEIQEVYESGKDQFPLSSSPEPGFKQRQKIAFAYFKGDFDDFLEIEMEKIRPTITTEQIESYYAANRDSEFKIPELPSAEDETDQPAVENPADDAADRQADSSQDSSQDAPESAPAGESAPESQSQETGPAEPEKAAADATPSDPEATEKPDAKPPEAQPDSPSGDANTTADEPATGQDEPPTDSPAGDDDDTSWLDGSAAQYLVSTAAQEPAAEEPTADEPVAEEPVAEVTDVEQGDEVESSTETPAQFKPLDEELRNEIREKLAQQEARPVAEAKLEASITEAREKVRAYARDLLLARQLDDTPDPEPLDFEAVAAELGLVYEETPLLDVVDVLELQRSDPAETGPAYRDFATATETLFDPQSGMVRRTIADVGFGENVELFTPRRLLDGFVSQSGFSVPPQAIYLYWRVEQQPEHVPPLEEIRPEVVAAYKLQQALPLAKKKAEEFAQAAEKQPGTSLAEVFPDHADRVIRTNEFSWMTKGATPMGGSGMPRLSQVDGTVDGQPAEVPGAGSEFMEAVFQLEVDQVGTAVNQPETVVFVARLAEESMSEKERRELFFAGKMNRELVNVLQMKQSEILRTWFDNLEEEFEVDWERDLSEPWQSR